MLGVETQNLRRVYGGRGKAGVVALDDISLRLPAGQVHGLLGPNGAGKTTLTRILCTGLLPSGGRASVLGYDVVADVRQVRRRIGVVFGGDKGLYPLLTARQNLIYWAGLYGVGPAAGRVDALLERFGLADWADTRVETFSRGMKQRLHLARGLIADAGVLFFDEPTMGMDPISARGFRRLVKELRAEGRTILLTTHDLAEAEAVCDQIALIDHGRLLAVETVAGLARLVSDRLFLKVGPLPPDVREKITLMKGVRLADDDDGGRESKIEVGERTTAKDVLGFLIDHGVLTIQVCQADIYDVYRHFIRNEGMKTGKTQRHNHQVAG